jgi:hypothetical protein
MKQYKLSRLSFGSYIKLAALAAFGTGVILGTFALLAVLIDGPTMFNGRELGYPDGILVGLVSFLLFPLSWGATFTVFAVITFPGQLLLMKLLRGIKIKAIIDDGAAQHEGDSPNDWDTGYQETHER